MNNYEKRNLTMLTDFYELTMMYGYFKEGKQNQKAVFDLFFRPFEESSFCIVAGVKQAVEYLNNLHFDKEDIEYLRSLNVFDEDFLKYLSTFKWTGTVLAMEEGEVVFPYEPIMVIEAPIIQAQLVEAALLNIINFQTLIATKARRVCYSASKAGVLEFGLRRAQGPDASVYGARASIIGGCVATSNVLSAQLFNLDAKGTHAHSWVMSFDSEKEAFMAYAKLFPNNCLLLVDTYDTLKSGVPNAIEVFKYLKAQGHVPIGIRLDSGDLAYLSKRARKMLDAAGFPEAKIFASGDIDEYVIQSLNSQGARIDTYGVGTKLITSSTNPSLGGVYKLAALDGEPKMKISDNTIKMTNPGKKTVWRIFDKHENKALADLITFDDEVIDETKPLVITHAVERWKTTELKDFYCENLLHETMSNGKIVKEFPTALESQSACKAKLERFWDEHKRLTNPHSYKVDLSDKLYELKQKLLKEAKK